MAYLSMFGGTLKNHSLCHLEQRQLGTYVTRSKAVRTNITVRGMTANVRTNITVRGMTVIFLHPPPSGHIDQFS